VHLAHSLTGSEFSDAKILAAVVIFGLSYLVFALGKFPGLKIDRPGAAVIGAVLMVALGIVGPGDSIRFVDFRTLVLLFSMMLVVSNLRFAGLFDWTAGFVLRHLRRPQLLPAVVFISGLLSAFFVNDIICLAMVPLVLTITRRMGIRPERYLIAVATASNIGSVATITGNPQNMLIGSFSGIGYLHFLLRLGPIALAGLFVDWGLLHWLNPRTDVAIADAQEALPAMPASRGPLVKCMIVGVLIVAGFILGFPPAMVAALGAAVLLITRTVEPRLVYDQVDWGLLIFFTGLFIIVGGARNAGLIAHFLRWVQPLGLAKPAVFTAFVALLGNLVSNVPAVMLMRSVIPSFADPQRMWLLLAMASTLAGNLTITGSVANIIVVETSRPQANIGFREYFRIGLPVTLITLAMGAAWVWFVR
jgi:Na+/H+ antiporter NhaD/arsenite permease-like protein